MLFYYQSWMFYNHFIVILYHFLVLTYWHSVKCKLLFFHVFYIAGNQYQTESKRNVTPGGFFWARRKPMGQGSTWGAARGEKHPLGRARRPRHAQVGVSHLGCPRTASLLYKYHNIPETLGESKKYWSGHRRVQTHQIQSRHRHGGVRHFHWFLSYDVWVVLCRPTDP